MKSYIAPLLGLAQGALAAVQGFDISHYQSSVNFGAAKSSGAQFVIIKATEGTSYTDPSFSSHYTGATNAGLIRGGYHFAHLDSSSGAAQAKYFLAHGGGWSGDGITLPGMLDLEGSCVLSASATVSWIKDFSNTYHSSTGVYPLIYTNPSWWSSCTGNSKAFIDTNPLVLARYASSAGTPPGGWPYYTIWQYNDAYKYGGDSDVFNGDLAGLKRLAKG
ncbi:glycoside hydrolase family 25 protein [Poronia punctata]|uniref:N,O-diacetylmuramidase n=1 Tax=Poronia punctata TaxID=101475 RepID=A0A7S6K8V3_9PEZI|nr:glycoside hydrolase family 25 protein [Poronia punctata]QNJ46209.1 GH25 muramidase [Poronia punctata]